MCGPTAFSQLTLDDVDSVSELGGGESGTRRPRLPMSYSSWLNQFNTNPYGASNVGHVPAPASNLRHIPPQSSSSHRGRAAESSIYAPPPPYNVVTAGAARIVLPSGCGSFAAVCKELPISGRSHSGLSRSVWVRRCTGVE